MGHIVKWYDFKKNNLLHAVNAKFLVVLSKYVTTNGFNTKFSVRGCPKRKSNHSNEEVTYHMNPQIADTEQHNFCMIDFKDKGAPTNEKKL